MLHHEGASRGFFAPASDILRVSLQMMPYILDGDPYYNPNLSYLNRVPALRQKSEHNPEGQVIKILEYVELVDTLSPGELEDLRANISHLMKPWLPDAEPRTEPGSLEIMLVSHDLSLSGAPLMLFNLARYSLVSKIPFE